VKSEGKAAPVEIPAPKSKKGIGMGVVDQDFRGKGHLEAMVLPSVTEFAVL